MGAPPQLILCYITAIAHHSEIHTRPGWKTLCAKPISNCNFSPSLLAQEQRGCSTQNTLQGGFPGPLHLLSWNVPQSEQKGPSRCSLCYHRGAHFANLPCAICHRPFDPISIHQSSSSIRNPAGPSAPGQIPISQPRQKTLCFRSSILDSPTLPVKFVTRSEHTR